MPARDDRARPDAEQPLLILGVRRSRVGGSTTMSGTPDYAPTRPRSRLHATRGCSRRRADDGAQLPVRAPWRRSVRSCWRSARPTPSRGGTGQPGASSSTHHDAVDGGADTALNGALPGRARNCFPHSLRRSPGPAHQLKPFTASEDALIRRAFAGSWTISAALRFRWTRTPTSRFCTTSAAPGP